MYDVSFTFLPGPCDKGFITIAQHHSTEPELRFCAGSKPCSWHVRNSQWWGSLTMVLAGNKVKRLLLVKHTTKIILIYNPHTVFIKNSQGFILKWENFNLKTVSLEYTQKKRDYPCHNGLIVSFMGSNSGPAFFS